MTVPPEDPVHDTGATTAPPKKRRRRTGAGGAQDDCFTCRKRAVACDRKRPYCTPCIQIGKDCSGYKTTLTWGVGVASRGKLRGLSSPVASRKPDAGDSGTAKGVAKRRKSSLLGTAVDSAATPKPSTSNPASSQAPASPPTNETSYPPLSIPIPPPQLQDGWHVPGFLNHRRMVSGSSPPDRLQTAFSPSFEHDAYPMSAMSMSSYADEWNSPNEFPHTPAAPIYADHHQNMESYLDIPSLHSGTDSYPQSLSSSIDSLHSAGSGHNIENIEPTQISSFSNALFSEDFLNAEIQQQEDCNTNDEVSLVHSSFNQPFFFVSPRLQSLISYYDKHICPFLVAFDSPDNPYRMHIINLSTQNEGLQHAIAALATNNMRMRQIENRKTGFVSEIMGGFDSNDLTQPTAEESCYKQVSIEQLNMQLADPRAAHDDSVLATLLVLCLFHVCDTGFSKFKTQLAGVQKLMSMRDPNTKSIFTDWVEMFFTWFDVMTSAVNDREAQVQSDSMDMLNFNSNLGALEQFSGCDGRLFKLIARLGRLNLLSQGRPVSPQRGRDRPRAQSVLYQGREGKWPMGKADRYMSAMDYKFVDGNGWGSPIIPEDDSDFPADDPSRPAFDDRREFWAEWHDIRIRLTQWQMDFSTMPSAPDSQSDPARLAAEQRDLLHISESFRYSALLYVTRLAYPFLPSAATQFQHTVSLVLHHITALPITSCVNKFLLWPLFIAGTECVDESHRDLIRARCIEIQRESGFFNNISCLEVLERVWMDEDVRLGPEMEIHARRRDSEPPMGCRGRQAFRWRRAMDRVDGEYIMI
ncbi:hypothetical protein WHR41_05993 [Cladosporium halotolerans]|uniref:Zn(2)-C6 fungal-type domain-containing protein n=1 Tax=Cladosporium halotolerans TaxID=1052096 RepID=A0AB34KPD2_9PEZI